MLFPFSHVSCDVISLNAPSLPPFPRPLITLAHGNAFAGSLNFFGPQNSVLQGEAYGIVAHLPTNLAFSPTTLTQSAPSAPFLPSLITSPATVLAHFIAGWSTSGEGWKGKTICGLICYNSKLPVPHSISSITYALIPTLPQSAVMSLQLSQNLYSVLWMYLSLSLKNSIFTPVLKP